MGKGSLPTGTEGSLPGRKEERGTTAGEVRAQGPRSWGSVSTGPRAGGSDPDQDWGDRERGRRRAHRRGTEPPRPQRLHYHRHRRQCPWAGGWAWRAEVPARSWLGEPETEGPSGPPDVEPALGTGRPAGLAQRSRVSLSRTLACLAGLHVASLCWRNSPSGRVLSVRMPHSTCLGLICIINTLLPLEEKL